MTNRLIDSLLLACAVSPALMSCSAASTAAPPAAPLPADGSPGERSVDSSSTAAGDDAQAAATESDDGGVQDIFPDTLVISPVAESPILEPGAWPGVLEQGIATEGGFHHERYKIEVEPGVTSRIWVESATFDTTLRIVGDGVDLYNDDFWDGTNSFLQFQSLEGGTYAVDVSSYGPGQAGDFTLNVATYTPDKLGQVFELGDSMESATSPHGAGPGSQGYGASLWFEARSGQQVIARVTSPEFDTTARIIAPSGSSWYNDDANDLGPNGDESNLDSTIDFIAPDNGYYQLLVAPYGDGPSGTFKVTTRYREPVVVGPDAEIPDMGYTGRDREGRVLGLFVGISAYQTSPLYACDDDAAFVFQALRERQMIAKEDTWLLTNGNATVENLENAIEELADAAGPDDTVVIFFSGHGGIMEAEGDDELDGTDETLVLYDGDVRDNDFVDWLDEVEPHTMVLAIDACQSGGFARDFMTEPGRIGFFSSDEDVLSDTAETYGAGGYLSYFLREAILGRADQLPADGALTVGELSDFLATGFAQAHETINPAGGDAVQRVLIERGSYNWNDVLWIYPRDLDGEQRDISNVCLHSGNANHERSTGGSCQVNTYVTNK